MKIKDIDISGLGFMLKDTVVESGVFENESYYSKNMTADEIYAMHQKKWPTVRMTQFQFEQNLQLYMDILIKDNFSKESFEAVAIKINAKHKENVYNIKTPSNAPSTIKKKGFDNPLIHTGALVKLIKYKVNDGSKKGGG